MDKTVLFYIALIINTIGFTLIGIGVGIIFNECYIGTLIGLGMGMTITAIIILKTVRRLNAYEKK